MLISDIGEKFVFGGVLPHDVRKTGKFTKIMTPSNNCLDSKLKINNYCGVL